MVTVFEPRHVLSTNSIILCKFWLLGTLVISICVWSNGRLMYIARSSLPNPQCMVRFGDRCRYVRWLFCAWTLSLLMWLISSIMYKTSKVSYTYVTLCGKKLWLTKAVHYSSPVFVENRYTCLRCSTSLQLSYVLCLYMKSLSDQSGSSRLQLNLQLVITTTCKA